jgi:hypothetical protein
MSKTQAAIVIETPDPAPPAPKVRLDIGRLADHGTFWLVKQATVPSDVTRAQLLDGDFWRRYANNLHRGDRIQWRDENLTRYGEITVIALDLATGKIEARELSYTEIEPATTRETERIGFTAKDLGIHDGFGVVRDADGKLVAKNIASYDEAMRRIRTEFIPHMTAQRQISPMAD